MIGIFYLLVSCLLLGLTAFQRHGHFLDWLFQTISFGLVLCFLWVTARWELISTHFGTALPLLLLVAVYMGFRRRPAKKDQSPPKKLGLAISGLLIFLMLVMNGLALRGYRTPKNIIEIASPFSGQRYIVLNGGGSPQINAHAKIVPQDYALDIVGLNAWGARKSWTGHTADLQQYEVYGDSLFSPVSGTILRVVDGLPDHLPPKKDVKNLAGNFILIGQVDLKVVLGHLRPGSIRVLEGQQVEEGAYLGQVGNSGNSSEPHLHLHIETGGQPNKPLTGQAVPFRVNGRYLVRGSIF
jgi:hypothetical protein